MDIGKRIGKAQERLDRQEVSQLLALPFEEVVERLAALGPERMDSLLSSYLRSLSTEALIEFAGRAFRMLAAWDLNISEEAVGEEQLQAWYRAQGYPQGEAARAMGPSFSTD